MQFFSEVDGILKEMIVRDPNESFLNFLNRGFPEAGQEPRRREARRRALAYVSGFNAADLEVVGVYWLVKAMEAEEQIEGDRAFRSMRGYADLVGIFSEKLSQTAAKVQTDAVVDLVTWKKGHLEISYHYGTDREKVSTSRALITLPLGVLKAASGQSGSVEFAPALPKQKSAAMNKLEIGKVIRVTLHFRERFWDSISPVGGVKTLSEMGFFFRRGRRLFSDLVDDIAGNSAHHYGVVPFSKRRATVREKPILRDRPCFAEFGSITTPEEKRPRETAEGRALSRLAE